MRIVFVNLHANEMLVRTMSKVVFKQSVAIKHKYLLDYLLSHAEYEVCTYINDRGFSLLHEGPDLLLRFLQLFKYMEHRKVLKINGIDKEKVTVIRSVNELRDGDIVIAYRHHSDQLYWIENVKAFKALSFIHFTGYEREAKRLEKAGFDCLFNESNLQKTSEVYRAYYHLNIPWVVHPFVYASRFENKTPFSQRKNMAFATGTITYKDNPEFIAVYGDPCDQPARKQIKDNSDFFRDTIFCTCSDYNEDSGLKTWSAKDPFLVQLYKKYYNRTHQGQQKKYFSFDMVEMFNSYKMCIVGEEILGVPGIGFVEGMACGCAYIGLDSPMYTDMGLIPGEHYVTYDGSIEDLRRVIEYYQAEEHQEELERIAKKGCQFVRENFQGEVVAERLVRALVEEQKRWKQHHGK